MLSCSESEVMSPIDLDTSSKEMSSKPELVGQHYNLNIIGMSKEKTADMTGSNGHVIFVGLGTTNKDAGAVTTRIFLFDSADSDDSDADFRVLDANGTDGEASFELPKPGYDAYVVGENTEPVMSDYSIFVRPLGKPGGWSTITTCADLVDEGAGLFELLDKAGQKTVKNAQDGNAYCSIEQVGTDVTMRDKGKMPWTNVTAELTSIVFKIWVDLNDDGFETADEIFFVRVPLFDDMIDGEYWKYDNNGLRLLQVRFYPFGTDVSLADDPSSWE